MRTGTYALLEILRIPLYRLSLRVGVNVVHPVDFLGLFHHGNIEVHDHGLLAAAAQDA
jgi:hypothetical protein